MSRCDSRKASKKANAAEDSTFATRVLQSRSDWQKANAAEDSTPKLRFLF